MTLSILVSELFTAFVRAAELAHVEDVCDLAGNFHLLKSLLAKWTDTVPSQPLVKTRAANKPLAVRTRCKVFKHVGANRADKLLEHLFKVRLPVFNRKLLELICTDGYTQAFFNV